MVLADFGAEVIRVDRIEGNEKREILLLFVVCFAQAEAS
jgi:crotonobetainyl-CoA:carnitine CoA-transferase CaiB-like acyl-CoA transferase